MGQAKIKRRVGFSQQLIEQWEADDCVNFSIALARITGWLLNVDWWSPRQNDITEEEMTVLRVYVADNREGIFDVRGVKKIADFNASTIIKLAKQRATSAGGVRTRYYSEAELSGLPLRSTPDEGKIAHATQTILNNPAYLSSIPAKPASRIPAYDAARYTFGRCVAYAEAMRELVGLQPVAILGKRFRPPYGQNMPVDGYIHSIVVHADGSGEDAWGIGPIADIADRFGATEFEISREVHQEVVANYNRTSREIYEDELKIARHLVAEYRHPALAIELAKE